MTNTGAIFLTRGDVTASDKRMMTGSGAGAQEQRSVTQSSCSLTDFG
jgi:hypothetical protein